MRLFATAYIKASWMRSTGASRASAARAGAQNQIAWHSFPDTSSDTRTIKVDANRVNFLLGATPPKTGFMRLFRFRKVQRLRSTLQSHEVLRPAASQLQTLAVGRKPFVFPQGM
jgi:hypothetical protein